LFRLSASLDTSNAIMSAVIGITASINKDNLMGVKSYFLKPGDRDYCSPDYYRICKGHQNDARLFGGKYNATADDYCSSINFGGLAPE
jgi:hypothetical protein